MITRFIFFCCCFAPFFLEVIHPVAGKPLPSGSHVEVFAIVHHNVSLPCRLTMPVHLSRVKALEWLRVDTKLTVHVLRDGEELEREKAAEYTGRTAVTEDGSLTLFGVTWRDNGTYRCVLLRGRETEEVFVSLIVAEVSEVAMIVRLTSAGELFIYCESGGWRREPLISLQDARRNVLAAETRSSVGPDNLYSVTARIDAAAVGGNGTLICRVEISGTSLVNENKMHITDEFNPQKAGPDCILPWTLLFMVLVCVIFVVAAFVLQRRAACLDRLRLPEGGEQEKQPLAENGDIKQMQTNGTSENMSKDIYTEYGDITKVDTTGASENTIRVNLLSDRGLTGVEASEILAARDREEMKKYKDDIISVGKILKVHPALIAAIISRQSRAGIQLKPNGFGQSDPNCFGLMQISRHYHAVKGNPCSRDHLDQGVTFFIQLIKTMQRTKKDWSKEQQLKGALACYIAGEERVIPLERYEDVDSVTPYGDFANDVIARAQWFARELF